MVSQVLLKLAVLIQLTEECFTQGGLQAVLKYVRIWNVNTVSEFAGGLFENIK